MNDPLALTENERFVVERLRELKRAGGHGTLTIEIRDGLESTIVPAPKLRPPVVAKVRC